MLRFTARENARPHFSFALSRIFIISFLYFLTVNVIKDYFFPILKYTNFKMYCVCNSDCIFSYFLKYQDFTILFLIIKKQNFRKY